MPIAAVVADANVLLSAAIGKAALKVFTQHQVEVHATHFNWAEVEKYLPRLAEKYRLRLSDVRMQWRLLPISLHVFSAYKAHFRPAMAELGGRDPDDAHAAALSLSLDLPLWSNDRDFEAVPDLRCLTTARLLKILESAQ